MVYVSESGEMIIFFNYLGDVVVFENFMFREIYRFGFF